MYIIKLCTFLNACFLCNLGRFDLWEKLLVLSSGNFSPYSNCLFATRVHEESLKYKNIEILSMRYRYVISLTLMKTLPGIMIMIFWTLQLQTKQDWMWFMYPTLIQRTGLNDWSFWFWCDIKWLQNWCHFVFAEMLSENNWMELNSGNISVYWSKVEHLGNCN